MKGSPAAGSSASSRAARLPASLAEHDLIIVGIRPEHLAEVTLLDVSGADAA